MKRNGIIPAGAKLLDGDVPRGASSATLLNVGRENGMHGDGMKSSLPERSSPGEHPERRCFTQAHPGA